MVAHRIESDPRWASAAERLRAATPAVTDMLRATGTEPMPDAVFDRFLAALPDRTPVPASAGDLSGADSAGRRLPDARRSGRPAGARDLTRRSTPAVALVGSGQGRRGADRPRGHRHRHRCRHPCHHRHHQEFERGGQQRRGRAAASGAGGVVPEITASGRDYGSDLMAAPTAPQPYAQSPPPDTGPALADPARIPRPGARGAPALQRLASGGLPGLPGAGARTVRRRTSEGGFRLLHRHAGGRGHAVECDCRGGRCASAGCPARARTSLPRATSGDCVRTVEMVWSGDHPRAWTAAAS